MSGLPASPEEGRRNSAYHGRREQFVNMRFKVGDLCSGMPIVESFQIKCFTFFCISLESVAKKIDFDASDKKQCIKNRHVVTVLSNGHIRLSVFHQGLIVKFYGKSTG